MVLAREWYGEHKVVTPELLIVLRISYAKSDTDVGYGATSRCYCSEFNRSSPLPADGAATARVVLTESAVVQMETRLTDSECRDTDGDCAGAAAEIVGRAPEGGRQGRGRRRGGGEGECGGRGAEDQGVEEEGGRGEGEGGDGWEREGVSSQHVAAPILCYAFAMRCPVLTYSLTRWAMHGAMVMEEGGRERGKVEEEVTPPTHVLYAMYGNVLCAVRY